MTSRERMLATIRRDAPDRVPLYCWVFGFAARRHLRWSWNGRVVKHWYSGRLEHIHSLPEPWSVEDDFQRVDRWLSLGLDDVLDVSVPWGRDKRVSHRDFSIPPGTDGNRQPLLLREYCTPDGPLKHAVRRTDERQGPGWVVQSGHVPLFDDFNIPRAVRPLVTSASDVDKVRWLCQAPDGEQTEWLAKRMDQVKRFARDRGVLTQAWSAFGMDAVVWMAGAEGAVMLCMKEPDAFGRLLDIIHSADKARTALALQHGADIVVQRGWYSSTDFWSPTIFRQHLKPRIAELASMAHSRRKLFGYVMTTGVMTLGPELADAGVDLLYFADPVQDHVDLAAAKKLFGGAMAIAGGVNSSVTLTGGSPEEIRASVHDALDAFGNGGGFILSPVDALFPDTPSRNVEIMIEAWRERVPV